MKIIEKASFAQLDAVLKIYEDARRYMRESGNLTQWSGGYPSEDVVKNDIEKEHLYICRDEEDILGVFYFAAEEDPTYQIIEEGHWLNNQPYAVIHRIAVSESSHGKGVASFIFSSCFEQYRNLKIDTHRDNFPMQKALMKNGFVRCGIIHLENGEERLAFQKI